MIFLEAEGAEHACPRQPFDQRGGLLVCARFLQAFEQACRWWRHGHNGRIIEGDAGGRITVQQRGDLVLRVRRPQVAQQLGYGARVIEDCVRDRPAYGPGVIVAEARRTPAEVGSGAEVAGSGGVLVQLGGIPVQTPSVGGIPERGLVSRSEVVGCRSPESRRGDLALPVLAAVLVKVIGEAVHRPAGGLGERAAQRIAPTPGSAFIQATAQEGRAWARLGDARQTRATLSRVEELVSPLPVPDRPEHHYRYDPPKAQFYVAATLSWLGDMAAEGIARQVLTAIEAPELRPRPRRAALARLDLVLALTAAGKHDEAAGVALEAVRSGRLARWTAGEHARSSPP